MMHGQKNINKFLIVCMHLLVSSPYGINLLHGHGLFKIETVLL